MPFGLFDRQLHLEFRQTLSRRSGVYQTRGSVSIQFRSSADNYGYLYGPKEISAGASQVKRNYHPPSILGIRFRRDRHRQTFPTEPNIHRSKSKRTECISALPSRYLKECNYCDFLLDVETQDVRAGGHQACEEDQVYGRSQ